MSERTIGPLNRGGSRPYAIDPEYADGYVCDLYHHWSEPVDDRDGRWNADDLRKRGHKLDEKVRHVCEMHYSAIKHTPRCNQCGFDMEEGKRGVWYCVREDCITNREEENAS